MDNLITTEEKSQLPIAGCHRKMKKRVTATV